MRTAVLSVYVASVHITGCVKNLIGAFLFAVYDPAFVGKAFLPKIIMGLLWFSGHQASWSCTRGVPTSSHICMVHVLVIKTRGAHLKLNSGPSPVRYFAPITSDDVKTDGG